MKRVLATILAFLYLTTSTDAAITVHYCMGKVASVDLIAKDKCAKCGMKSSKGCCRDEVKILKIQDKHQLSGKTINIVPSITLVAVQQPVFECSFSQAASKSLIQNNSPPGETGISLNILYSVFRI